MPSSSSSSSSSGSSTAGVVDPIVLDEDLPYEEDVLRNPYSVKHWLRYLEFKADAAPYARNILYERALAELPRSYKLWRAYLTERRQQLRNVPPGDPAFDAVNAAFERCLVHLHKMPRIWLDYGEFLMSQKKITKTRQMFDRALRSLPVTQHDRIWPLFIKFVRWPHVPAQTGIRVYKRYLKVEPSKREEFVDYLIERQQWDEAALQLSIIVNEENYKSRKGKSQHELWMQLCDIISKHSDQIKSIKVEQIIRGGLTKFSESVGKLWTTLADYYIRLTHFEKVKMSYFIPHTQARDIFEEGMETVITVKDFTQIWDAYAKFEDSLIAGQMEEEDEEDEDDFDLRIARYENLIDRQPLLVNSVLLRQNPHDVSEWQKRADLYKGNPIMVVETYTEALTKIDPQKAKGKLSTLWVNFAKFYEQHNDIKNCRKIFEKGTQADFKYVDDLATVWCEYAEMELRHKNYDLARSILERATTTPRGQKKFGEREPVQRRVYKSTKLWAFYADIEESLGTFQSTKAVYEKILDLRVATPNIIINYAHFLEEHKFFEESFKAYEKGIALFNFPHVFDIWVAYLTKFVARYGGKKLERARELFEQVVESAPKKDAKYFYVLYANLEEEYGLARHAMGVYDRATRAVADEDKFAMFCLYINRATEFFGVTRTREIYERAIEVLPDKQTKEMCLRYAELERRLGEIDRARAIYVHGSQFADPSQDPAYWQKWREFEVEHGNEDTFREMLRIKRSVQAQYSTQINFIVPEPPTIKQPETARFETDMEALERLAEMNAALKQPSVTKDVNPEAIDLEGEEEEEETEATDNIELEQLAVPQAVIDRNVPKEMPAQKEGALERLKRKRQEN